MQADSDKVMKIDSGARIALDVVSDTWTPLVVYALGKRTMRTGDLMRTIPGISQKMLTQTLRKLERYGLIQRQVFPEVPPRVEYSLTDMGQTLREPLRALCHWGQEHRAHLMEATKTIRTKKKRS